MKEFVAGGLRHVRALRRGKASSGGGVKGGVFAVERCVRKVEVKIGLYPRGQMLGGKQVRLLVLPVLPPALFEPDAPAAECRIARICWSNRERGR